MEEFNRIDRVDGLFHTAQVVIVLAFGVIAGIIPHWPGIAALAIGYILNFALAFVRIRFYRKNGIMSRTGSCLEQAVFACLLTVVLYHVVALW